MPIDYNVLEMEIIINETTFRHWLQNGRFNVEKEHTRCRFGRITGGNLQVIQSAISQHWI